MPGWIQKDIPEKSTETKPLTEREKETYKGVWQGMGTLAGSPLGPVGMAAGGAAGRAFGGWAADQEEKERADRREKK